MRDNWLNHNTDKVLLFVLVFLAGIMILHMGHDSRDANDIAWAEHSFDVVLGALMLVLTGRLNRADGQTGNGIPPGGPPAPAPGIAAPTLPVPTPVLGVDH